MLESGTVFMNAMFEAAKEICDYMQSRHWKFCIIGGLAVVRWGEPRLTQDADLSLLTGFGEEEPFAAELLARFKGRLGENTLGFALTNRVLLLHASNGVPLDVAFSALDFEVEMMERVSAFEFAPDVVLPTCSAEDLFIMKAFAGRAKDWLDVDGLVVRQVAKLDCAYILKHLEPLCELKEAPEIMEQARKRLGLL